MRTRAFNRRQRRVAHGAWRPAVRAWPFAVRHMVLALCALALAACGIGLTERRSGLACIDDSARCIGMRQAALEAMLADRDRTWVKERPTPEAHASGVRLFAYRRSRRALTCAELSHGRREAAAVPGALRGRPGLSPPQVSRAILLAAEVQRELAAEMRRRCHV